MLQKICELHERPNRTFPMVIINCNSFKMLPNRFLTSISPLLEVSNQLAICQLAPGPLKEHLCFVDARQATETSHGESRLKRSGQ